MPGGRMFAYAVRLVSPRVPSRGGGVMAFIWRIAASSKLRTRRQRLLDNLGYAAVVVLIAIVVLRHMPT